MKSDIRHKKYVIRKFEQPHSPAKDILSLLYSSLNDSAMYTAPLRCQQRAILPQKTRSTDWLMAPEHFSKPRQSAVGYRITTAQRSARNIWTITPLTHSKMERTYQQSRASAELIHLFSRVRAMQAAKIATDYGLVPRNTLWGYDLRPNTMPRILATHSDQGRHCQERRSLRNIPKSRFNMAHTPYKRNIHPFLSGECSLKRKQTKNHFMTHSMRATLLTFEASAIDISAFEL